MPQEFRPPGKRREEGGRRTRRPWPRGPAHPSDYTPAADKQREVPRLLLSSETRSKGPPDRADRSIEAPAWRPQLDPEPYIPGHGEDEYQKGSNRPEAD
jgi:hypothetical protein